MSNHQRTKRNPPLRVGIGGPVGSGKTTLVEMLCKSMRDRYDLVVITNDIYTKEDQRLLIIAGTAVRFEPGQERTVELVELAGDRIIYGFNAKIMGKL